MESLILAGLPQLSTHIVPDKKKVGKAASDWGVTVR